MTDQTKTGLGRRVRTIASRVAFTTFRATLPSDTWSRLQAFCLFCGYGRSGHSAIGSLLDAHPDALVSHELHAVKRFVQGVDRGRMFEEIAWRSRLQARRGRRSSRVDGGWYLHALDGLQQGRSRHPTLIGDKKGGRTTHLVRRHGVGLLREFEDWLGLPLRIVHVVRNPYDIVAADLVRGGTAFTDLVDTVSGVRREFGPDQVLDVYYEDVLAHPAREIERLTAFLGLPATASYLDHCEAYLFRKPHRRRFEVEWPEGLRDRVARTIDRTPFLSRYDWDS